MKKWLPIFLVLVFFSIAAWISFPRIKLYYNCPPLGLFSLSRNIIELPVGFAIKCDNKAEQEFAEKSGEYYGNVYSIYGGNSDYFYRTYDFYYAPSVDEKNEGIPNNLDITLNFGGFFWVMGDDGEHKKLNFYSNEIDNTFSKYAKSLNIGEQMIVQEGGDLYLFSSTDSLFVDATLGRNLEKYKQKLSSNVIDFLYLKEGNKLVLLEVPEALKETGNSKVNMSITELIRLRIYDLKTHAFETYKEDQTWDGGILVKALKNGKIKNFDYPFSSQLIVNDYNWEKLREVQNNNYSETDHYSSYVYQIIWGNKTSYLQIKEGAPVSQFVYQ